MNTDDIVVPYESIVDAIRWLTTAAACIRPKEPEMADAIVNYARNGSVEEMQETVDGTCAWIKETYGITI